MNYNQNLLHTQSYPSAELVPDIFPRPEDTSLEVSGTSVTSVDSSVQKNNGDVDSSVEDYKSKNDDARHKMAELLLGYIGCLERGDPDYLYEIGINKRIQIRTTNPQPGESRYRTDWVDGVDILRRKALNLARCGDVLKVGCHECNSEDLLDVPQHCRSRVCRACANVRRSEWVEKYLPVMDRYDLKQLRHLTLTLQNCDDLYAGLKRIIKSFRTLRLIHFPDAFTGGLVGYEAHIGRDGKWNVHCHVLYAGKHIKQSKLSDVWLSITGDSKIVYISSLLKKGYRCKHREKKISARQSGLEYLLKYVTKGVGIDRDSIPEPQGTFDWTADDWAKNTPMMPVKQDKVVNVVRGTQTAGKWNVVAIAHFLLATHNMRLLQPFGTFMGATELDAKPVFDCPSCGSELIYLTDHRTGKVLYDAYQHYGVYSNMERVRAGPSEFGNQVASYVTTTPSTETR